MSNGQRAIAPPIWLYGRPDKIKKWPTIIYANDPFFILLKIKVRYQVF